MSSLSDVNMRAGASSSSSDGIIVKGLKRIGEVVTHNVFIGIAYTYSQLLYNVTVVGRENLQRFVTDGPQPQNANFEDNAAHDGPPTRPLLSVSNHHSTLDDALTWANLLSARQLFYLDLTESNVKKYVWPYGLRKMWAAREHCFNTPTKAMVFNWMRCIPIVRGDGLNQQGVVDALDHLNNGGWMHLHPEGKVNKDLSNVLPLRHGVGKLIAESKVTPVVLPIFHLGMANVISYNGRFPRPRADLLFMVGKPIYFDETLEKLRKEGLEKVELYNRVTDVVEGELRALEKKANWLYRDIYKHEPYPNYVPPG